MLWSILVALVGSGTSDVHAHVFPERNDDAATRAATWAEHGGWATSTYEAPRGGGTRVAAIFTARTSRAIEVQARGLDRDEAGACTDAANAGPWLAMEETFARGEARIAVRDLGAHFDCAQLRMRTADSADVEALQWELRVPAYPDAGRRSRELTTPLQPELAVGAELERIGVISREQWGARASQCSSVESDWYRMAIHHTAGPQTVDGTVEGQMQATQAYAMDSGGYCDIPYQMLVGYDGSLWEGRGLTFTSGATGGGNNPGNLAVCFIGCYHSPDADCVGGQGHEVGAEMMHAGQLLVQTLVRLEDIDPSEGNIQGHRDWPGNSTACPGSILHPRLDELRADLAWFSASEVARSWDDAVVEVPFDEPHTLWIEFENTGGLTWQPGETFLAPTEPRDTESPLHDASWPMPTRAATVSEPVAPGAIGRFTFDVRAPDATETVQAFGLVHDGSTWFSDTPWGGGPADDIAIVRVVGVAAEPEPPEDPQDPGDSTGEGEPVDPEDTGADTGSTGFDHGLPPGFGDDEGEGCGCTSAPRPFGLLGGWVLLCVALRRRSRSQRRDEIDTGTGS
jgi:hypothetical protein